MGKLGHPEVYVDAQGKRLLVGRCAHYWFVGWESTQVGLDPGCALYDWVWLSRSNPEDVEVWELQTSCRCVVAADGFAPGGRFATRKQALAARDAANRALLEGKGKPWPEWAREAKKAGWKPPRGWKP